MGRRVHRGGALSVELERAVNRVFPASMGELRSELGVDPGGGRVGCGLRELHEQGGTLCEEVTELSVRGLLIRDPLEQLGPDRQHGLRKGETLLLGPHEDQKLVREHVFRFIASDKIPQKLKARDSGRPNGAIT